MVSGSIDNHPSGEVCVGALPIAAALSAGSLGGALWARLALSGSSLALTFGAVQPPLVRTLLLALLLPCLLLLAQGLRCKPLFYLVLFGRGFLAASALCLCAGFGVTGLRAALPGVLLRELPALPFVFSLRTHWDRFPGEGTWLWVLPALALLLLGPLLCAVLF